MTNIDKIIAEKAARDAKWAKESKARRQATEQSLNKLVQTNMEVAQKLKDLHRLCAS